MNCARLEEYFVFCKSSFSTKRVRFVVYTSAVQTLSLPACGRDFSADNKQLEPTAETLALLL